MKLLSRRQVEIVYNVGDVGDSVSVGCLSNLLARSIVGGSWLSPIMTLRPIFVLWVLIFIVCDLVWVETSLDLLLGFYISI
jgi:hypothetical protein